MANEIPISVVDRKIKVGRHVPATMTNIGKDYLSISLDNEWSSTNHRLRVTLYSDAPYVSVQNWWDGKSAIEIPQEITSCPAFKVTVALISEDGYERLVTQAMDEPIENPRNGHDEGVEPGARTMDIIARIDALAADLEQKRDTDYWRGEPGAPGAPGAPGEPGADGYSPTANVTKDGGTATITVTDKNGTTTATVSDGAPGSDANVTKENVEAALGYEPLNAAYANKIYIMQKQIENLQGIAATEETDSTEAYTKTVPTGAQKWASLDKVGGKTVVWNQLAPDPATYFAEAGISYTINGEEYIMTCSTTSNSGVYFENANFANGHKYLFSIDVKTTAEYIVSFKPSGGNVAGITEHVVGDSYKKLSNITAATGDLKNVRVYIYCISWDGNTTTFKNPCIFDLTKMFGAGNEPATVEEFRAMFPADYYPYNPGELMSAEVVEVESKGKNLLDPSYSTGAFTGGMPLSLLKVGESYTISSTKTRLFKISDVYDGNGTQKLGESFTFTVTSDNVDKRIFCLSNNSPYLPISIDDVRNTCQIERGTIATPYSPYFKGTFPIPQSVRDMCPGYGWSAGTVCNEIDFAAKKYVQRVGSVDLGTLEWNADTRYDNVQFYSGSIVDKTIAYGGCICAKYSWVKNQGWASNVNKTIGFVSGSHQVLIVDNDYQDAGAFKVAMQGVLLYYELAEPIEIDLSNVLTDDNFIEVEAGGTVTFKQASTQLPVPSSVTYQISTKEVVANA